MRLRPKYLLCLSWSHGSVFFRTEFIFSDHHFDSSSSLPIGTPSETHHPFSLAHLISLFRSCALYFPIARPSRFFNIFPHASCPAPSLDCCVRQLDFFFGSQKYSGVVANCDSLYRCPLISIPFIPFSMSIATFIASATTRNSSGDSGHPCATPDRIGNHSL